MDASLLDLLQDTATESSDENYTHLTYYGPKTKWVVPFDNQSSFWEKYCELISTNNFESEPQNSICLAEAPRSTAPIIGKFTFKYQLDYDDTSTLYDVEFLYHLCHVYQTVIEEYFDFQSPKEQKLELVACIFESTDSWTDYDSEYHYTEVMIQFPYSKIDIRSNSNLVRDRVIQLLRKDNIMSKMNRSPIGDWEEILSSMDVNTPIPLYGSNDNPCKSTLELKCIWKDIDIEQIQEYPPENFSVDECFVFRHFDIDQGSMDENLFEEHDDVEFWLPLFLSTGYWDKVLRMKRTSSRNSNINHKSLSDITFQTQDFGSGKFKRVDETDYELAETMITMISTVRFLNEIHWLDIGKGLYNSYKGDEKGMRTWIKYTENSIIGHSQIPDFLKVGLSISDTCQNLYYSFDGTNITHLTLAWYARDDNPDKYSKWHNNWCLKSMDEAMSCTHTDVAIALYRCFWLDFVFASSSTGKGTWFSYHNHHWFEDNQALSFKKKINDTFIRRFERIRKTLVDKGLQSTDELFKAKNEITIDKLGNLIKKLKNSGFKNCINSEAMIYFNRDNFTKLLNSDYNLLGVINGVLECTDKNIKFRVGKPEDFITMNTGIVYRNEFTWDSPSVKKCLHWFGQVYPDKDLYHHVFKFAASCIKGRNSDKIFGIWTGAGDNSKSMIVKLYERAFGDYCIKFNACMLSEKSANSGNATPQLARAKSTRVAFMDEPEDDIPFNKGAIKKYTGGDSFNCRQLYSGNEDIILTFKLILVCNDVPPIANADKAVVQRSSLFPHKSKWVDNPPETEEEQNKQLLFKKDTKFENTLFALAPAFLWIATQYFPHYINEGLESPLSVTMANDEYWKNNDDYGMFINDCIQLVKDSNGDPVKQSRLTLTTLYAEFRSWFGSVNPNTKAPNRKQLKSELTKRWGPMAGNVWYGIKLLNEGDDDFVMMDRPSESETKKRMKPQIVPSIPGNCILP
ncbi:MAG: hypothetical protein QM487_10705 [Candidatus Marithrix sp.]